MSALGFLYANDPTRDARFPDCLLLSRTGLYCAGCGITRALHALLHGRMLEAMRDNGLMVVLLPWLLHSLTINVIRGWRADQWPSASWDARRALLCSVSFFVAMFSFTILRNLPGAAFEWLRPIP
jgi:hypothetical protein